MATVASSGEEVTLAAAETLDIVSSTHPLQDLPTRVDAAVMTVDDWRDDGFLVAGRVHKEVQRLRLRVAQLECEQEKDRAQRAALKTENLRLRKDVERNVSRLRCQDESIVDLHRQVERITEAMNKASASREELVKETKSAQESTQGNGSHRRPCTQRPSEWQAARAQSLLAHGDV